MVGERAVSLQFIAMQVYFHSRVDCNRLKWLHFAGTPLQSILGKSDETAIETALDPVH